MSKFTAADFTREEMLDLFDRQMRIVELSLAVSFNKFATRKEETIQEFSNFFNVPKQVFEDHAKQEHIKKMWRMYEKIDKYEAAMLAA